MLISLTPEQTQLISGGDIAIDIDANNFILVPTDSIPKPCAKALEYAFNGLLTHDLTSSEVLAVTLVYGKCTLSDYQLFITNIETALGKS